MFGICVYIPDSAGALKKLLIAVLVWFGVLFRFAYPVSCVRNAASLTSLPSNRFLIPACSAIPNAFKNFLVTFFGFSGATTSSATAGRALAGNAAISSAVSGALSSAIRAAGNKSPSCLLNSSASRLSLALRMPSLRSSTAFLLAKISCCRALSTPSASLSSIARPKAVRPWASSSVLATPSGVTSSGFPLRIAS